MDRYTMAVDYGDGWVTQHRWVATEAQARRCAGALHNAQASEAVAS